MLSNTMHYTKCLQTDELHPAFMQYIKLDENLDDKFRRGAINENNNVIKCEISLDVGSHQECQKLIFS